MDENFLQGGTGGWKSTDQSISDMCRDMQEYPQKHKENLQKITKSTVGARSAPTPAEGGVVDFVYFFVDFLCVSVDIPAYLCTYLIYSDL